MLKTAEFQDWPLWLNWPYTCTSTSA